MLSLCLFLWKLSVLATSAEVMGLGDHELPQEPSPGPSLIGSISWKDAQNKKASAWCSYAKQCDSERRLKRPRLCGCSSTTWLHGRILGHRDLSLYNYKAVLVQTTCIYWSLGGRKEKRGERSRTEMVRKRTLGKGTNQGFSPCWWKWAVLLFCSYSKLFGILFFSLLDSIKLPWGRTIVTTAN